MVFNVMDTAATRPTAKRKRRRRVRSVRNKVDSAGDENDSDHLTVRNTRLDADASRGNDNDSCSQCSPSPMDNIQLPEAQRKTAMHPNKRSCDICRRRNTILTILTLATASATVAVSSSKNKTLLPRMSLLMLCLGSMASSSSLLSTAAAASSVDSPIKTPMKNEGMDVNVDSMHNNNHGHPSNILHENISDEAGEGGIENNNDDDEIDFVDDDMLEDLLLSDYDNTLDISGEDVIEYDLPTRPKLTVHSSQSEGAHSSSDSGEESENDSVIILSSVDGTLAGISRTSGQILWKQSRDQIINTNNNNDEDDDVMGEGTPSQVVEPPVEWNKFLSPLVSTTTKSSASNHLHNINQWHAVPSIDGTVYLTAGDDKTNGDDADETGHELSISTHHIRDLVDRSPFVDAHQRFFVGSRRAMVAAVDEQTGEILRVIPKWNKEGEDDDQLPPSLEGRDVVWIGRLEHTVTVHDLNRGTVDIEFSVAEILSVDEMIYGKDRGRMHLGSSRPLVYQEEGGGSGDGEGEDDIFAPTEEDDEIERLFTDYITEALRHPSGGDRILRLPAPNDSNGNDENDIHANARRGRGSSSSSSSINNGSPFLVSTPSGNVAFRDQSDSSTVGWVSFDLLDSPVVYAIEAKGGRKIRVNMLDDSSVAPLTGGSNEEGLPQMLKRQIDSIEQYTLPSGVINEAECSEGTECRAVGFSAQGSVVVALQNGQMYALPLGDRISRPQLPLGLPQPHSKDLVNVGSHDDHIKQAMLSTHHAIGFHDHRHDADASGDVDSGDKQHIHLDIAKNNKQQSCTASSPLYPGCLIGASLMMGNLMDVDGNLDMASVFASSDLDYDLYLDMLDSANSRKKGSYFQQFLKIMSSWIAPTVALLFVLSFEVGRRERVKAEAEASANGLTNNDELNDTQNNSNLNNNNIQGGGNSSSEGVIQVSDEILGYGGHGTIVYRGVLDKRQVAVKRLLAMYHASADREISLLIESDGHPNVVRYFLKEMRGEFVYLALELCSMSLNDLIGSLSKLRNARKENFQLMSSGGTDDFESATKSLLFGIASGVRHIHSLRIVHRDLKPQNILLALPTKSKPSAVTKTEESGASSDDSETEIDDTTHTTCSDTNTILEYFRNQEYVAKISDMGLGKQLAGQSSFGLSTLGTGSVGGGAAGDAGAGAGSVGWQAPEVMAMRHHPTIPESSSSNNGEVSDSALMEASPLESGLNNANRTSRSVDIFSLGCIFYCTILPGSHPFGEWYEREANIMKNTPKREDLEFVSPDASDLILSMIHRDAKARPTAEEVCQHPFFWSLSKRLKFLCELSDRIELSDASQGSAENRPSACFNIFAIERGAVNIFGTSWEKKLDPELIEASLSRRTYDPSSVRDCLRMIRNKHHHYDELSTKLKSRIGSSTVGLSSYVTRTFPRLLMHCYHFCVTSLAQDDSLAVEYKLPILRHLRHKSNSKNNGATTPVIADLSALDETKKKLETIVDDAIEQENDDEKQDEDVRSCTPELEEEEKESGLPTSSSWGQQNEARLPKVNPDKQEVPVLRLEGLANNQSTNDDDLSGIVVWGGSNTAKELNCRGWHRSDEEWTQRLDAKLRKRDSNLTRCADDPKFRTRLCNHWDVSQGTHCPMKKKNKCIFAHGPVELRVKEGKRHRWGKLVRKDGLSANLRASGGEDTYGAARSIEKTRKEQGQWTVDSNTQKKQGKGKTKGGGKQQISRKKKEQI